MDNNVRVGKLEIINILLILIIAISFLLLPWFKISEYVSITGLNGFFRYYNLLNSPKSSHGVFTEDIIFSIYLASLYLILLFILIAVLNLFHDHNVYRFNECCKIDYVINLMICILTICLKFIINDQVTANINSFGFGFEGYMSSYVESIFTYGSGFYTILICSVFGLVVPFLFWSNDVDDNLVYADEKQDKQEEPKQIPVDRQVQPRVDRSQTISSRSGPRLEAYLNQKPKVTLIGERNVEIYNLPTVIGRNKEQVNTVIPDPSISRVHCRIELEGDRLIITDLGSSYGTGVNGKFLQSGQSRPVFNNDILELGDLKFKVLSAEASTRSPSYLSETISIRSPQQTTRNSLDEDYVPKRESSPKLYTENILVDEISEQASKKRTVSIERDENEAGTLVLEDFKNNKSTTIRKTPFVLGSDAIQVDMIVEGANILARHLKILKEGPVFKVQDLGSKNGTMLNGESLNPYKVYNLKPNDLIRIGGQEFRIKYN